jgi:hypothetical protein
MHSNKGIVVARTTKPQRTSGVGATTTRHSGECDC